MKIIKGKEEDCICHKPKGRHTHHCQEYRKYLLVINLLSILDDSKAKITFRVINQKGE